MSSTWKGPRNALWKIQKRDGTFECSILQSTCLHLIHSRYITWVEKSEEQLEQEKKDRKKNKMLRDDEEITQM